MSRTLLLLAIAFTSVLCACDHFSNVCSSGVSCPASVTFTAGEDTYALSELNFISFGDFTIDHGDTEGRTIVKGNLNAPNEGVSFGYALQSETATKPSLVVGGNVNWMVGETYPLGTGFFVGGAFTGASTLATKVEGPCSSAGCLDAAFDSVKNYYSALSSVLAAQAQTVTTSTLYQALQITCTSSAAVQYVSISTSDLSALVGYNLINCDASAQFVINVVGSGDVVLAGNNFPSGRVIFNIASSTKITTQSFVYGSIIAVNAALYQSAGTISGQVIVASAPTVVQANLPLCNSTSTSTSTSDVVPSTSTSAEQGTSTSGDSNASTSGDDNSSATSTSSAPSDSSTTTSEIPQTSSTSGSVAPATNGTRPIDCVFLDNYVSCATTGFDFFDRTLQLSNFDVIVFGDLSAGTGDIQGRAFVSGSVTLGNGFSFGQYLSNSNSNDWVLVAGSLDFTSGSFSDRRALVAGSVSVPSYLTSSVDRPCTNADCLDDITTSAQGCYNQAQSNLAALSDTATVVVGSNVAITCNTFMSNRNVFTISGSDLSAAQSFTLSNCMPQTQWIINVVGSDSVSFSGDSFPATSGDIIFNIQGSGRTISVSTGVNGAILAPSNSLTMDGGVIHGKVVVSSAQIVQINLVDCPAGSSSGSGSESGSGDVDAGQGNTSSQMGVSIVVIVLALIAALF